MTPETQPTKKRRTPAWLVIGGALVLFFFLCVIGLFLVPAREKQEETPTPVTMAKIVPVEPSSTTEATVPMAQVTSTAIRTATPTRTVRPSPCTTPTGTPTASATPSHTASATPMPKPVSPSPTPTPSAQLAQVTQVIDGDTIEVSIDGQIFKIRYIGIDTPETVHPEKPVEWMGAEATRANKDLVEGKTVRLEKDVSETDKYARLLRYVWLGDLMVNAELVRLGFAQVSTYPPDVKYQDLFGQFEGQARDAERGLWAPAPTATALPTATPTAEAAATVTVDPRAGCDPSYPDVCIPPYPPDLNCGDIPYCRFRVLPPDPHGFDGDHDGIGCATCR